MNGPTYWRCIVGGQALGEMVLFDENMNGFPVTKGPPGCHYVTV